MEERLIDTDNGLVRDARQLASPNQDARPPGSVISLLILHGISLPPGKFGGPWIDALFSNRLDPEAHPSFREIHRLRVSAHLLIRRDGSMVQYVPLHRRAWHAGKSCWEGVEHCNDYAIGVELEGTDTVPYDERQYARLLGLIPPLMAAYPAITPRRIVGHSDVAPGRKTDPGPAFDWARLREGLASIGADAANGKDG